MALGGITMGMTAVDTELDAGESGQPRGSEPPTALSPAQQKALAHLCQLHERGLSPRRFSRRSLLIALYIAFTLGFAVLLLPMAAFAPPGYLFLGFVLGALLKELRILMIFRRIWPVYETIIDWPRAYHLLKSSGEPRGKNTFEHDA
jgi:hypothetical protein